MNFTLVEGIGLAALQTEMLPMAQEQHLTTSPYLQAEKEKSGTVDHSILGFFTEMVKSAPTMAWRRGRFCGVTSPLGNQPEKYQKQSQKWLSGEYVHLLPTWTGLEHMT